MRVAQLLDTSFISPVRLGDILCIITRYLRVGSKSKVCGSSMSKQSIPSRHLPDNHYTISAIETDVEFTENGAYFVNIDIDSVR